MATLTGVVKADHCLGISNINYEQQESLRNNTSEEVAPQMVEPSCDSGLLDDGLLQTNLHVYKQSCEKAAVSRGSGPLKAGQALGLILAPSW
jgi:hypothetical protein